MELKQAYQIIEEYCICEKEIMLLKAFAKKNILSFESEHDLELIVPFFCMDVEDCVNEVLREYFPLGKTLSGDRQKVEEICRSNVHEHDLGTIIDIRKARQFIHDITPYETAFCRRIVRHTKNRRCAILLASAIDALNLPSMDSGYEVSITGIYPGARYVTDVVPDWYNDIAEHIFGADKMIELGAKLLYCHYDNTNGLVIPTSLLMTKYLGGK